MKKTLQGILDYLQIAVGSFLVALGVNFFLVPCKISTGGVSGLGTIFYYFFGIPLSLTVFIVNVVLFLIGYRLLKRASIIRTGAGILFLSLFLELTEGLLVYSEDLLIASVFGGILVGAGVGLTVLKDASTGGSDFLALMLHKLVPHISVAGFMLLIDSIVIAVSGLAFRNYTVMLYSVISLYICSKVADLLLVRGEYAKSVLIISRENERIAAEIMQDMERGVTGIYSRGFYGGKDGMMLMCIVRSKELPHLIERIERLDKNAFTVISEVRQVVGAGFGKRMQ